MSDSETPENPPLRGRPKTRFSGRDEQVRQNMRIYRARRGAELEALGRALELLLAKVEGGDLMQSFSAAAAVSGVWKESVLRSNLLATAGKTAHKRLRADKPAIG